MPFMHKDCLDELKLSNFLQAIYIHVFIHAFIFVHQASIDNLLYSRGQGSIVLNYK